MFLSDLETYNDQEFAEAYAAGLYDVNRLRYRWDRDLTPDENVTEKDSVIVFDGSNGNPVMNMLKYISENYEGDEKTYTDNFGDDIARSYILFLVAHKSSGIDSWVVLNSLVEEITELKFMKPAKALISSSFWCGVKIIIMVEVPQCVRFTCKKSHIKGFLENIGREYGLQPGFLKGEIERSVVNKSNFADLGHNWVPCRR